MERRFRITVDGRHYDVTVEEITENAGRLIPDPGSMHVPQPPPAAEPATTDGAGPKPGEEVSPLAGILHSVDVAVGQAVERGDKIASVEAMKMLTSVLAHGSGKVACILVKPGDPVDAGQPLMTIE